MNDNRSKYFVFVPFCLMAQAYPAQGIVKYEWKSSIKPFMDLLLQNDINIIQMPCAESTFNNALIRVPKGNVPQDMNHMFLAQPLWRHIGKIDKIFKK